MIVNAKFSVFKTDNLHMCTHAHPHAEREGERLLGNKSIIANHQILIILVSHIHLPQASKTKTWI